MAETPENGGIDPEVKASAALGGPHGPVLNPVQARTGARRGIYRILAISIGLTVVAFVVAWMVIAGSSHATKPQADPEHPPATETGMTTSATPKPAS